MQLLRTLLSLLNRKRPPIETNSFFEDDALVRGLNLKAAVRRVAKSSKSDLIFDPVGFHEFEWIVENQIHALSELVTTHYQPTAQIVLNMPKKGLTFRPVSYLLPIDSIIYQSMVDKIIRHRRAFFSKQVYSHIIGDVVLGPKYNRYVDEFHILAEKRSTLLGISLELSKKLRELGLNQNAQKSNFLVGKEIMEAFNRDRDFFNHVKYLKNVKMEYEEAREVIADRFSKFLEELKGGRANYKIFRYCLRRFTEDRNPTAIDACFEIAGKDFEQLIDIVRYLAVFATDRNYSERISSFTQNLLRNEELNYSNWAEAWLFGLLYELSRSSRIDLEYISKVANDKNKDDITRSLCYLILSRSLSEGQLIGLCEQYEKETSPTIKRALLTCISRLPRAARQTYLDIQENDDINIRVLKLYLAQNSYPDDSKI